LPIHPYLQSITTVSGRRKPLSGLYAGVALLLCLKAALVGWEILLNGSLAVALACVALWLGYKIGGSHAAAADMEPFNGLLPQGKLHDAIGRHLAAADAQDCGSAVIHCELTHGLMIEEQLIHEASAQLLALIPAKALVARAGRQSFQVFLPGEADPFTVASLARAITGKLGAGLSLDGARRGCACHCGIALCPQDGSTPEELLRSAELALAAARDQETTGYAFFDPRSAAATLRHRDVQRAVAAAHASGSLRLVYQPLHDMRSGELTGFEALMRMADGELGPVPPSEFIPAAEQAGLITEIGAWALDEACRTAALWPPHLVVAVNLSPAQFLSGTIVQVIRRALETHSLPAYRLEVEITEGTVIKDSELVLSQLRTLRDMGVGLALDDFGTGYSSLGYLWKFPFSKLKIDRSFVAALDQSASAKGILRSIVKLGHGLGMKVTAEGIESQRQLSSLKDMGCDLAQGYLLGRPAEQTDLAAIIMRNVALQLAGSTGASMASGPARTG
jgi:EAL domain-containing protein (putative c-di-GMP-specific phosphodiesterase class I)/GGDEF domain-containing protein